MTENDARDAQNWRAIRDLVHKLDEEARPGGKMADDDVLDVVCGVLRREARRAAQVSRR